MGYDNDSVRKIMQRTMDNLRFVDKHDELLKEKAASEGKSRRDDDEPPFEATQLLNSFLGALIQPWETLRAHNVQAFAISLEEARHRGWPVLRNEIEHASQPKTYAKMLGKVRNAFAHGGLELLPDKPDADGRQDISGIRIWNTCPECECRSWQSTLSLKDLKDFLRLFEMIADDRLPRRTPLMEREASS